MKPEATIVSENVAPGITVALVGDTDWMAIDGGGKTVIVSVVFAVLLDESFAVMVNVCVPTSLIPGTQLKLPPASRLLPSDTLEPEKASES